MVLYRVARDGRLRWWAPLASPTFNDQLRVLPDGLLYEVEAGTGAWIPVVTELGAPLSVSAQRRLTQPVPVPSPTVGISTATAASYPAHEVTVAVVDAAGHASRTWRITSTTDMAIAPGTWPTCRPEIPWSCSTSSTGTAVLPRTKWNRSRCD